MNNDRFNDFDDEDRQLVLDFENTVLRGGMQFFDVDELEVIIDYYFEVNDLESLQRAVEYAEQLYPDSTTVRLRRAHLLIAQEKFEAALKIIKQLRRQEPNNTDVAYSLGVAYGAVGESRKAIDLFLEAAADGWMLGRVYGNMAEEYFNLREYDEAIRYYQLALDTDSFDPATLYNYLDTSVQAGRVEDAITYLKSFVGEHPYSGDAWHCIGSAYRQLGLYEQAADAYEYAIAIDKTDYYSYLDLSSVQEAMGQTGDAVSTLLRARDYTSHRADLYRDIACIYARVDNAEMAILYFRKAVEENPDDAELHASLALTYSVAGDLGTALPIIKKALRMAPNNAEVLGTAALIYDAMDNFEAASDFYERMITSEECSELQCQRYLHFLYKHKVYEVMIDFATESLELYPQHPFYSTYLVAACFHTNRYNRAAQNMPYIDPALLNEICPEIADHPRLGPLIPHHDSD
ncbi:MAG: tetratricopeptide repeat protein [Bacteroidales bacterium]|nr:tetratricopeptide repeat protein [Bacteroidales bacterium]